LTVNLDCSARQAVLKLGGRASGHSGSSSKLTKTETRQASNCTLHNDDVFFPSLCVLNHFLVPSSVLAFHFGRG
jgi:hypothetical protein